MAEISKDLIDAFRNFPVSTSATEPSNVSTAAKGHVLSLEFPAMDLLPQGIDAYFERPSQVERRQEPDSESQNPHLGTGYFTMLTSVATGKFLEPPNLEGYGKLALAVNALKGLSGSSTLRLVAFRNLLAGKVIYRCQLLSDAPSVFGHTTITQEFELDEDSWFSMRLYAEDETWVSLLHDLVSRSSERAFLEVRARLVRAFPLNWVYAHTKEPQRDQWNTVPPQDLQDAFLSQLEPATEEDADALSAMGDRWLDVYLPCGHIMHVRKIELFSMNIEACRTAQCPTCSHRIMPRSDEDELVLQDECRQANEFRRRNKMWRSLDEESCTGLTKLCEFNSRMILEGLDLALTSFAAPRLICPKSLTPTTIYSPATTMIVQRCASVYGRSNEEIVMSPARLFENLYSIAMSTETGEGVVAKVAMPPDWEQFLARWLIRAMNFLLERRCARGEAEHQGVHEHEDGWCYHADAADIGVPGEIGLTEQVNDIQEKLSRASIAE